jgi:hypothetical protein
MFLIRIICVIGEQEKIFLSQVMRITQIRHSLKINEQKQVDVLPK